MTTMFAITAALASLTIVMPCAARSSPATRPHSLPSELVFISNENGTIDIYDLTNPGPGPVATITGLIAFQQQMVVDKNNDLFVVNNGTYGNDDFVSEYVPPYSGLPVILSTLWNGNTLYPVGVAVDAKGTVYVSTCGTYCLETPEILEYANGSTVPTSAITSTKFDSLGGLAVDKQGDLYIGAWNKTTFGANVLKLPAGSTTPRSLELHGLIAGNVGLTNGVSLDANGDIFVSSMNGTAYILEYRLGQANAFRIIDPFLGQNPLMIDVGPDGNLYVPTDCVSYPCPEVYVFRPGAKKSFESIGTSQGIIPIRGVATAPNLQLQGASQSPSTRDI